jgi:hypothetical protein
LIGSRREEFVAPQLQQQQMPQQQQIRQEAIYNEYSRQQSEHRNISVEALQEAIEGTRRKTLGDAVKGMAGRKEA